VEDAKSAIRWVRAHAQKFGIDPGRIGAAGGSAGGQLAASTANLPGFDPPGEDGAISSRPDALVLFNPALIIAPVEGLFELAERFRVRVDAPLQDLSPYHHVGDDQPPTLIMHGTEDELFPLSTVLAYCERVVERQGSCEVAQYEGAGHGFFNRPPHYEPTLRRTMLFLESLGWLRP
jgi:acetyl esterase/lipase